MRALSSLTGIGESQLANYKNGKVIPTLPIARRIAAAFGMSLDDLLFAGEARIDKRSIKT